MISQVVSPRVEKVSEEVEGGDSVNEGASESNDGAACFARVRCRFRERPDKSTASVLHTVFPLQRKFRNNFGHIFITGAGARTACLDVE